MTDQIILQLITTVISFCNFYSGHPVGCFTQIWQCGHNVSAPSAIPSQTHNCISDYVGKK